MMAKPLDEQVQESAIPTVTADLKAENARLESERIGWQRDAVDRGATNQALCAGVARPQEHVKEAESHGCQDCAYEVGVPVPGPTGLCPKHADEQIDGRHSERRRRVEAERDRDRYKARAEKAIQRGVELWKVLRHYTLHSLTIRRLLSKVEAQAERCRKEILRNGENCRYCSRWHHFSCRHITWISTRERCPRHPCSKRCKEARAALASEEEG